MRELSSGVYGTTSIGLMFRRVLIAFAGFSPIHFRSKQKPRNWRSVCSSFSDVTGEMFRPARICVQVFYSQLHGRALDGKFLMVRSMSRVSSE
jgi:hypothetical protein